MNRRGEFFVRAVIAKIRAEARERGITERALADVVGVHYTTISGYLNMRTAVPAAFLFAAAEAVGIDVRQAVAEAVGELHDALGPPTPIALDEPITVTARATFAGDKWAVKVDELPKFTTHETRLSHVAQTVRDAVSAATGVQPAAIVVEIIPLITGVDLRKAERARQTIRDLVDALRERGVAMSDISEIID